MSPEMPTATAPARTTDTHSNYRWVICGLLFWVTTANYVDRGVFGNLAPEMPGRLHVSKAEWDVAYWNMQIFFQAAYAVSMLLMGRLMDGLGLRWGFAFACAFWGLASMSHAFAPEIGGLFGSAITGFFICRILLGLGEGGNFPAAIKATAEWFPKRERALATGLFNSGSNVGGLLVPWALPFVVAFSIGGFALGWRGAFFITAIIDLCWIIAWLMLYRKPEEHPRVSKAELALIQSDAAEPTVKIPWRKLLPHKQMWAFAVAKFMTDCFWWFYLFGSPDFFNKKFNLDPAGRKYMIMMIYVIASVGSIAGGWLAGAFMKRGWSLNKARKITMLICSACVLPVVYSAITEDKWVAAVLITLAASAHQAWSANVFSLAGDMFPRRVVGSVTGLGGMIGALGGMALFYITGKVLHQTGNYLPVFVLASLAYIVALLIVHLIVPRLETAQIEERVV
ncbi:MAG: MFS transporter [Verrucomicrobiia bacterium]|jgi:ACS family hexuronate transporter-like MFS transporter